MVHQRDEGLMPSNKADYCASSNVSPTTIDYTIDRPATSFKLGPQTFIYVERNTSMHPSVKRYILQGEKDDYFFLCITALSRRRLHMFFGRCTSSVASSLSSCVCLQSMFLVDALQLNPTSQPATT